MRLPAALLFAVLIAYTTLLAATPYVATAAGNSTVVNAFVLAVTLAVTLGIMLAGRPSFPRMLRRGSLVGLAMVFIGLVVLFAGGTFSGGAPGTPAGQGGYVGLDNRNLLLGMMGGLAVLYAVGFAVAHRMLQKGTVKGAEDVLADPGAGAHTPSR